MNIVSASIRNYRAISNLDISFVEDSKHLRPVTVIVGPNGSGKTSVLYAITQALRGALGFRTDDVPEPSNDDIRLDVDAPGGWTSQQPEADVSVTLQFDAVEREAIPRLLQKLNKEKPPDLDDGKLTVHWRYPPPTDESGETRDWWYVSIEPSRQFIRSWLQARRLAIGALRKHLISLEDATHIGGFEFFPQDRNLSKRVVGEQRQDLWSSMPVELEEEDAEEDESNRTTARHERSVSEILRGLAEYSKRGRAVPLPPALNREEQIRKAFELVCSPKTYAGFLSRQGISAPVLQDGRHRYPLSHAASGEQVILEYFTRLIYRGPLQRTIVLIDESEVHLHPKWVRKLYLALPQIGESNQFVMTTHSNELRARAAADNCLIELGNLNGE